MKKKFGILTILSCFGLLISGCKAGVEDVKKESEKMDAIIKDGTIFTKDYSIISKIISDDLADDTMDAQIEYKVVKDETNYYYKITTSQGEEIKTAEVWIKDKDENTYVMYMDNNGEKSINEVEKKNVAEILNDLRLGASVKLLDYFYTETKNKMDQAIDDCDKEGEVTCKASIESKNLLLHIYYPDYKEFFTIKDGRLNKLETTLFKLSTTSHEITDFTYDDQAIALPNEETFLNVE